MECMGNRTTKSKSIYESPTGSVTDMKIYFLCVLYMYIYVLYMLCGDLKIKA